MFSRRELGVMMAAGASVSMAASADTCPPTKISGKTRTETFRSSSVPTDVGVTIYTPPGYDEGAPAPYPLMLLLHGGNGSERDLLRFTPAIDRAISDGSLHPMVIAMPGAGRSLYMDYKDGSQRWETFILAELIPGLRRSLAVSSGPDGTFIGGWSMGGLGSLRLAFKHPEVFKAVAALEPAIEPALFWNEIGPRVRFWRPESVVREMFGTPVAPDSWERNNPATIARKEPGRLMGLGIYLEVGDQDMLYLHEGTEFLHRILFDAGLAHEFRLVNGADHVGPSLAPRLLDGLGFISRQIVPPGWIDQSVVDARAIMDGQKQAIGMQIDPLDPRRIGGR